MRIRVARVFSLRMQFGSLVVGRGYVKINIPNGLCGKHESLSMHHPAKVGAVYMGGVLNPISINIESKGTGVKTG